MSTNFTSIRGEAQAIEARTDAPSDPVAGQIYLDTTSGILYTYVSSVRGWKSVSGTTTSTSTSTT